jgi:Tol biopolymer transport system component
MDGMESLPNLIIPSTWWIPGPHISSNDKIIFRDRSIEKNGAQKNTINYELFTYDNGKIKQLTKIGASISQLSISPDGSRAVFSVEKNGEEENSIWIVNTDGSGLQKISVPWNQLKQ